MLDFTKLNKSLLSPMFRLESKKDDVSKEYVISKPQALFSLSFSLSVVGWIESWAVFFSLLVEELSVLEVIVRIVSGHWVW